MNKLDTILCDLIRSGRLTVTEALAIGASVRFCAFGIKRHNEAECDFSQRYGTIAGDEARGLCLDIPSTGSVSADDSKQVA